MARIIVGLASLFWLAINPAWAEDGIPANSQALSEQVQVKLYRLHYAKADLLAKELSAVCARQDVHIGGDARTNSLIVVSPPAVQDAVAVLIARLDVPNARDEALPSNGRTTMTESVPIKRSDLAEKPLDHRRAERGGVSVRAGEIAVMRISPATAKALEAVMQPKPSQPPQEYQDLKPPVNGTPSGTAQSSGEEIRILRIPPQDAAAVAKALSSLFGQGPNPRVIVVAPPKAPATVSHGGKTFR